MATQKGRNVRIEVAATYSPVKPVSAITKANPALVTSAAHGLAEGTIGYFSGVIGMDEMEGQAASVDTTLASTFLAEGLDASSFGTFTGTCSFTPVATWLTVATSTSYQIDGGAADQIDETTLLDNIKKITVGQLGAQTVSIDGFSDPQQSAMQIIESAAIAGSYVVIRITFANGERRVFRGQPSLPGESMALSAIATGSFSLNVKGRVLKLLAA